MFDILFIFLLTLALGLLVQNAGGQDRHEENVEMLLSTMPQSQCGKCGYSGCRPYAEAIAEGKADIYQCAPGGMRTIKLLTGLLGRHTGKSSGQGISGHSGEPAPGFAVIDENSCIGCAKCIPACPVDAIIGAPKQLHSVLAAECTACELCIPPCPMNCIDIRPKTDHKYGG